MNLDRFDLAASRAGDRKSRTGQQEQKLVAQ
jgi:hypothetical protein